MKPLNVEELKEICEEQIAKGNGKKTIMISKDDEGNGYHYLWYAFSTAKELELSEYEIDTDIASIEETIILG